MALTATHRAAKMHLSRREKRMKRGKKRMLMHVEGGGLELLLAEEARGANGEVLGEVQGEPAVVVGPFAAAAAVVAPMRVSCALRIVKARKSPDTMKRTNTTAAMMEVERGERGHGESADRRRHRATATTQSQPHEAGIREGKQAQLVGMSR